MTETIEMTRLIVRYLLALILVLSYASLLCLGQSAKQPRILDTFQKKSDSLNYAIFNGQRAPTKDLLSDLEGQMVWDEARPEPSNPMGQRLRFVPIDEPGKDSGGHSSVVFEPGDLPRVRTATFCGEQKPCA